MCFTKKITILVFRNFFRLIFTNKRVKDTATGYIEIERGISYNIKNDVSAFGGIMYKAIGEKRAAELIEQKLAHFIGVKPSSATDEQFYEAVSLIIKDILTERRSEFDKAADKADAKKIYYLCMEFLMGRSLKNNLYNLNLTKTFEKALAGYSVKLEKLFECEPDAGLGNGGLGRLAACYLDALATDGFAARGYSILYEAGIFKQKFVDGWQTELPDFWLPGGKVWLTPHEDQAVQVHFGGNVIESWDGGYHRVLNENYTAVQAIPYDMYVCGKDGRGISVLRLWKSQAPALDMQLFNEGQYMRAVEQGAMAEVISKVLYPSDNNYEGKSLRLKQQYFLVSASIQDIVHGHLAKYGTMDNFPEKAAIHINDTHPTLSVPELMRILLDECGFTWENAWSIVSSCINYTNHTVMKEALEVWPEELFKTLLPRIYQITKEIDNRFRGFVWESTNDADKVERMAIVSSGVVRMANLCVATAKKVNGVSALHSEILKDSVFNDFYTLTPNKFTNITNGIAHRRWLCQANPRLTAYLSELIGTDFIYDGSKLSRLNDFAEDKSVLSEFAEIKRANKADFSEFLRKNGCCTLDPDSLFDVQVKRLHEYKRQELNALNILVEYLRIKDNPNGDFVPHTYIFGAKAAPGYILAKKIIQFIIALGKMIDADPDVKGRLKVCYVEDYNVSKAESLMPAADISQQISLAGTEASGTGNMKLMINGAITLGTMDGANIEIFEQVGKENMFIFGMNAAEVSELTARGYEPINYYHNNAEIKRAIDFIMHEKISGVSFPEIVNIIHHDPYMVLADFADYRSVSSLAVSKWANENDEFVKMALKNTANAGIFAADRAVREYAHNIWDMKPVFSLEELMSADNKKNRVEMPKNAVNKDTKPSKKKSSGAFSKEVKTARPAKKSVKK